MIQKYAAKLLACNLGMTQQEATSLSLQRIMNRLTPVTQAVQQPGQEVAGQNAASNTSQGHIMKEINALSSSGLEASAQVNEESAKTVIELGKKIERL